MCVWLGAGGCGGTGSGGTGILMEEISCAHHGSYWERAFEKVVQLPKSAHP